VKKKFTASAMTAILLTACGASQVSPGFNSLQFACEARLVEYRDQEWKMDPATPAISGDLSGDPTLSSASIASAGRLYLYHAQFSRGNDGSDQSMQRLVEFYGCTLPDTPENRALSEHPFACFEAYPSERVPVQSMAVRADVPFPGYFSLRIEVPNDQISNQTSAIQYLSCRPR
jgi:hypothetical protein